MRPSRTAANASSSRSKTRAGPAWRGRSCPAAFTTAPSGARLPVRMYRPPLGLSGAESGLTTCWPGASEACSACSVQGLPSTTFASPCKRPPSRSLRHNSGVPPARWKSVATKRPPGFRSAISGVRRLMASKSPSSSGTPASLASASRWRTALVDPPVAATPAMAFSNEARFTTSSGRRFSRRSWTTCSPAARVAAPLRGSSAGMLAYPTGARPSSSVASAMVFAVYWPPHAPGPGQATSSRSCSARSVILPAAWAPTASKTSWMVTSRSSNRPGAIEPPYRSSPGRLRRRSAMAPPGMVLSQPTSATTASNRCERQTSSIESAITSRLTSDPFMPSVPITTPSLTEMVLNSIGVAPAARMPSFTRCARLRRWKLHGIVSVQVCATATSGRARSSVVNPIALSIARAGARSGPSVSVRLLCRSSWGMGSSGLLQRREHRVARLGGGDGLPAARRHVGRERATVEGRADRPLDGPRLRLQAERMAEHQRHAQDRPVRVRDAPAGDVRRRAVDGLVEAAPPLAQRGRGQQADGAGEHRRHVGEDVAEEVLGDDHVEARGPLHEEHGAGVDQHVLELQVGELVAHHLRGHLAPQPRGLEHVRLVHRGEPPAPLPGHAPGDAHHAPDLLGGVHAQVGGAVGLAPLLAEVQPAGQLAHHHQVHVLQQLGLERRRLHQAGMDADRTQVGVQLQLLAQAEQPLLRTHRRVRVPLRPSDGPEEHRVRAPAQGKRLRGQRRACLVHRHSADERFLQLETMPAARRDRLQHAHALRDHLGPDAVSAQDRDQRSHAASSQAAISPDCESRKPSSSTPFIRQWRAKGSSGNGAVSPPATSVRVSRSMVTCAPGLERSRSCAAGSSTTGMSPFFSALLRKMSAIDELTTARKPKSCSAQGACSREEPQPKLAPATSTCAPAACGWLRGKSGRGRPSGS